MPEPPVSPKSPSAKARTPRATPAKTARKSAQAQGTEHATQPTATTGALREVPEAVYARLHLANAPLTAYDLIESVQKRLKRRLHPPTIYRALSQLVERGLIHRLESGNSYVACASPGEPHHSILFVCNSCGTADEAVDNRIHQLLHEDAGARQFSAQSEVIEVRGLCVNCRGST